MHRNALIIPLLVAAVLLSACGKKAPPSGDPPPASNTPNPPNAPPEPKSLTPKEKIIGAWEREPKPDGHPFSMAFRRDGTATLKHRQPDGREPVTDGKFTAPDDPNMSGDFGVTVQSDGGGYGFQISVADGELMLWPRGAKEAIRFRKAK